LLEVVRNEGDFEFLQAMEFLLEQAVGWRAFGVAWRNVVERWDADAVFEGMRNQCERLRISHDGMLRQHLTWFDESKKAHGQLLDIQRIVEKFVGPYRSPG
jgi:hypothetical protein